MFVNIRRDVQVLRLLLPLCQSLQATICTDFTFFPRRIAYRYTGTEDLSYTCGCWPSPSHASHVPLRLRRHHSKLETHHDGTIVHVQR
jgi:hypothetical protein